MWAAIAFFLMAWACEVSALEGRVIDASTGRPLSGVYVIGAWEVTTPFPVQARSGCAKLDLVSTDDAGRYSLPAHSGRILARLIGSETINIYFYKSTFRVKDEHAQAVVLELDSEAPSRRIAYLRDGMARADCGDDRESTTNRLTLYRAMYAEAESLATSAQDRRQLFQMLFWIDLLEVGQDIALERLNAREAFQ